MWTVSVYISGELPYADSDVDESLCFLQSRRSFAIIRNFRLRRANKAQFTHVALRGLDDDEVALAESSAEVALPSVQGVAEDVALAGISDVGEPELQRAYVTPESLGEGLVTLSTMPRAKWQTLINLDVIKVSSGCYESAANARDFTNPHLLVHSDGTNRRRRQRRPKRRLSSFQRWQASSSASRSMGSQVWAVLRTVLMEGD